MNEPLTSGNVSMHNTEISFVGHERLTAEALDAVHGGTMSLRDAAGRIKAYQSAKSGEIVAADFDY